MKHYYYLYTSLLDLSMNMDKLPYTYEEILELLKDSMSGADLELVKACLYRIDNENLIKVLENSEKFIPGGCFKREELEEEVKIPSNLPSYMQDFLENKASEQPLYSDLLLRDQLEIFYYKYLCELKNDFLCDFAEFEFNLRNVQVAFNCRKFELDFEKNVLLLNEESSSLLNSSSADFGLAKHYSWLPEVLRLLDDNDIIEKQRKLDEFRLETLEAMVVFNYFDINAILAYFVRYTIIARWFLMEEKQGIENFDNITNEMVDKVNLMEDH